MNNKPQVSAHSDRPEILVFCLVQLVESHPRIGRVHLKVERGGFHSFLFVSGQATQTIGKGVANPKVHLVELDLNKAVISIDLLFPRLFLFAALSVNPDHFHTKAIHESQHEEVEVRQLRHPAWPTALFVL